MAQDERYGTRDLTYSAWHRHLSTQRFIGIEKAQLLAMIDIDVAVFVEYDEETKQPLALVETARDVGQSYKCATITRNLAIKAGIEAFVLLYKPSVKANPADANWPDIDSFRIKRIAPTYSEDWIIKTPQQWAECLITVRSRGSAALDKLIRTQQEATA